MSARIQLTPASLPAEPFGTLLRTLRERLTNGGAYLAAFNVSADEVFDWYASRNRLWERELLDSLLVHPAIRGAFPELLIPRSLGSPTGIEMLDPFLLDGKIAHMLYRGGAYWQARGDGKAEKVFALEVCDAMFGLRFGEINCDATWKAWTDWFGGIAWDITAAIFDRRLRRLWILVTTDWD